MFFPRSCKADMLVIQTQTWAVKEKRPLNPPLQSYRVFISYLEKDHFYSRPQRTSKHCLLLGRLKLKSELPAAALETKEDKRKREREREKGRKKERGEQTVISVYCLGVRGIETQDTGWVLSRQCRSLYTNNTSAIKDGREKRKERRQRKERGE